MMSLMKILVFCFAAVTTIVVNKLLYSNRELRPPDPRSIIDCENCSRYGSDFCLHLNCYTQSNDASVRNKEWNMTNALIIRSQGLKALELDVPLLSFESQVESWTKPKSPRVMKALFSSMGRYIIPDEPDMFPTEVVNHIIKDDPDHYLSSCVPTSQYLIDPRELHRTGWILHSFNSEGLRKNKGGDELYVTYRDRNNDSVSPTAIARVEDMQDGSYKLDFVKSRSPMIDHSQELAGMGSITIHLHYTCFAGHLDPPAKNTWVASGALNIKYDSFNPLRAPPMRDVEMPRQLPELAAYDNVYTFGNSLTDQQFFKNFMRVMVAPPKKPNIHYMNAMQGPLNTDIAEIMSSSAYHANFGIRQKVDMSANNAIMVGSCVWDVMAYDNKESSVNSAREKFEEGRWFEWNDHLEAIEILITGLRQTYPGWKIYWKGCTAIQIHGWEGQDFYRGNSLAEEKKAKTVWYSSYIRSQKLDKLQKELLEQMDVPVMDLWDLSFDMAEFLRNGDTRHYEEIFYDFSLDHIYGDSL